MIKISKLAYEALKDKNGNVHGNPITWWKVSKLATIWCVLCMIVEVPVTILRFVLMAICFVPHKVYEYLENVGFWGEIDGEINRKSKKRGRFRDL